MAHGRGLVPSDIAPGGCAAHEEVHISISPSHPTHSLQQDHDEPTAPDGEQSATSRSRQFAALAFFKERVRCSSRVVVRFVRRILRERRGRWSANESNLRSLSQSRVFIVFHHASIGSTEHFSGGPPIQYRFDMTVASEII